MFVAIDEQHTRFVTIDDVEGVEQKDEGGSRVLTADREYQSDLPARDVAQRFEDKFEEMRSEMMGGGGLDLDI